MADHESLESRLERLRAQTEKLRAPANMAQRLASGAVARSMAHRWPDVLIRSGRKALVVAALTAAITVALAYSTEQRLKQAITWIDALDESI